MRKRQTFMLTVLSSGPEELSTADTRSSESASFVGQIKVISSGKALTFTSLEELVQLISAEMAETSLIKDESPNSEPRNAPLPPSVPSTGLAN